MIKNQREAKILALEHLSEWAWDYSSPLSCKNMTCNEKEAKYLALAFEEISLSLYKRKEKLKNA